MKSQFKKLWIDVGSYLGETTFEAASKDPNLLVLAFEPNLSIAKRTQGLLPNYINFPVAIGEFNGFTDFYINKFRASSSLLPINPQGLKSWFGKEKLKVTAKITISVMRLGPIRISDIDKIQLEVDITDTRLYSQSAPKDEVIAFMKSKGFFLSKTQLQCFGQEENLTFKRICKKKL